MVGWHHRLNGHEFEQAPGVGDGQGSLACFSPWSCKDSDTTEKQLTDVNKSHNLQILTVFFLPFQSFSLISYYTDLDHYYNVK